MTFLVVVDAKFTEGTVLFLAIMLKYVYMRDAYGDLQTPTIHSTAAMRFKASIRNISTFTSEY